MVRVMYLEYLTSVGEWPALISGHVAHCCNKLNSMYTQVLPVRPGQIEIEPPALLGSQQLC